MSVLLALLLLVLAPVGVCAVICCAGWWATLRARLEHREHMYTLAEQAKRNAIDIDARRIELVERSRL